jgi:tetratricopeptide (TPR) repeat protein
MTIPSSLLEAALSDRYRIQRELGAGGMATVYLAQDLKHDRPVAIKVLRPELAAAIGQDRFLREIAIAARLQHPHILSLHDSGRAGDLLYYVMPYVEGESLRERLTRERQIPLDDALDIAREVADALEFAHSRDVVHRDIKPENILLASGHALVADFGIARAVGAAGGSRLTETGLAVGTPAYMSPEQSAGDASIDGRSDIYSLGTVLYEMLAGTPPFTGPSAQAVMARKATDTPPPIRSVRDSVAPALEHAVLKAMARFPADRFATVAQFRDALTRTAPFHAPRPRARRFAAMALGVVAAGGLAGFLLTRDWGEPPLPVRTILTDVEGSARQTTRRAARELIRSGLDESRVLLPLGEEEVRAGLATMLRADSLPLDATTGKELAFRSNVGTVLVPSLEAVGSTLALTLRVLDPKDGAVLATERASAPGEEQLIPAIDGAVRRLQRKLGERRSELAAIPKLTEATTASFEAYRKLVAQGPDPVRLALWREAIAIDPGFAAAWRRLTNYWNNNGNRDSTLAAAANLERTLNRGTERERLEYRVTIAVARNDYPAALALYDRLISQYGPEPGFLNTRGLVLHVMGRTEEAIQAVRQALAVSRFPVRGHVVNLIQWLNTVGRPAEARRAVDSIRAIVCRPECPPAWRDDRQIVIAFNILLDEWDRADSLIASGEAGQYAQPAASLLARRGAVREAEQRLDGQGPGQGLHPEVARLLFRLVRGPPWSKPRELADHDQLHRLEWVGIWEGLAGDSAAARRIAAGLPDSIPGPYRGAAPEMIRAVIAMRAGQWRDVVSILGPVVKTGELGRGQTDMWVSPLPMRWMVAQAYERLGMADSAAATYEQVLWPGGSWVQPMALRGITYSFAHQRLVILYARLGRLDDANRHFRILTESFTTPDPEFRPLLAEARESIRR